jgi:hypothetical protein
MNTWTLIVETVLFSTILVMAAGRIGWLLASWL